MTRKMCLVAMLCALLLGAQALDTGSEPETKGRKVLSHMHDDHEKTCCKYKKRCLKWRKKCWWDDEHHWKCARVCKKWRKYCVDWCDYEDPITSPPDMPNPQPY